MILHAFNCISWSSSVDGSFDLWSMETMKCLDKFRLSLFYQDLFSQKLTTTNQEGEYPQPILYCYTHEFHIIYFHTFN